MQELTLGHFLVARILHSVLLNTLHAFQMIITFFRDA